MLKFNDYYSVRRSKSIIEMAQDAVKHEGKEQYENIRTPLFLDQDDIRFLRYFPPQFQALAYHQLLDDVLINAEKIIKSGGTPPKRHDFTFNLNGKKVTFKNVPVSAEIFKGHDEENPMGFHEKLSRTRDEDALRALHKHPNAQNDPYWVLSKEAKQHYLRMSAENRKKKGLKGPAGFFSHALSNPKVDADGRKSTEGLLIPQPQSIRNSLINHARSVKHGFTSAEDAFGPEENIKAHDPNASLREISFKPTTKGRAPSEDAQRDKSPFERMEVGDEDNKNKYYTYSYEKLKDMYGPALDKGMAEMKPNGDIEFYPRSIKDENGNEHLYYMGPSKISKNGEVTWVAEVEDSKGKRQKQEFTSPIPIIFPTLMYPNHVIHNYTETLMSNRFLSKKTIEDLIKGYRTWNENPVQNDSDYRELSQKSKSYYQATGAKKRQINFTKEEAARLNNLRAFAVTYPKLISALSRKGIQGQEMLRSSLTPENKDILAQTIQEVIKNLPQDLKDIVKKSPKIDAFGYNSAAYSTNSGLKRIGTNWSSPAVQPNKNTSTVTTEGIMSDQLFYKYLPLLQGYIAKSVDKAIQKIEDSSKKAALNKYRDSVVVLAEREIKRKSGTVSLTAFHKRIEDKIKEMHQEDMDENDPKWDAAKDRIIQNMNESPDLVKNWREVLNKSKSEINNFVLRIWQKNIDGTTGTRRLAQSGQPGQEASVGKGKGGEEIDKINSASKTNLKDVYSRLKMSSSPIWSGQDDIEFGNSLGLIRQRSKAIADEMKQNLDTQDVALKKLQFKLIDASVAFNMAKFIYQSKNPNASADEIEKFSEMKMREILDTKGEDEEEVDSNPLQASRQDYEDEEGEDTSLSAAASHASVIPNKMVGSEKLDAEQQTFINSLKGQTPEQFKQNMQNPAIRQLLDNMLKDEKVPQDIKDIIGNKYSQINMNIPKADIPPAPVAPNYSVSNAAPAKVSYGLLGKMKKHNPPADQQQQKEWLTDLRKKYNQL